MDPEAVQINGVNFYTDNNYLDYQITKIKYMNIPLSKALYNTFVKFDFSYGLYYMAVKLTNLFVMGINCLGVKFDISFTRYGEPIYVKIRSKNGMTYVYDGEVINTNIFAYICLTDINFYN